MDGQQQTNSEESGKLLLRADRAQIEHAQTKVLAAMDSFQYPEPARFAVRLALEEALSNAIRHGHKKLPDVPVTLEYRAGPQSIELVIEDKGPGFNPDSVPDPTLDENLELPAGRGLLLMRAYMTSVRYNPKGNRVTMLFQRPADKGGSDPR